MQEAILNALKIGKELTQEEPSRELSLTITKLEEAEMWANKIPKNQPNRRKDELFK